MFHYTQPNGKAQALVITQAYMDHLLKTHSQPGAAPQPRLVFVPPRRSWTVRAITRVRKWRVPPINEVEIVLAMMMIAGTGVVLHAAAFV